MRWSTATGFALFGLGAVAAAASAQTLADVEAQYQQTCGRMTTDNIAVCAMMRVTLNEMARQERLRRDRDEDDPDDARRSAEEAPHPPRNGAGSVGGVVFPSLNPPQRLVPRPEEVSSPVPTPRAEDDRPGWAAGRPWHNPATRQRVLDSMGRQPVVPDGSPTYRVFHPLPEGYGNAEQRAYWEAHCAGKRLELGSMLQSNCDFLLDRTGARRASSIEKMRPDGSFLSEPRKQASDIYKWRSPDLERSARDTNPINPATRQPCVMLVGSEWQRTQSLGSDPNHAFHVMTFHNTCTGTAVIRADRGAGKESSGGVRGGDKMRLTCANYGPGSCPNGHSGWYVHSYTP